MIPNFQLPAWMSDAACAKLPVHEADRLFYPTQTGASSAPAKAVCRSCPVAATCLAYAMELESHHPGARFGVWGGVSERTRRNLAVRMKPTCAATVVGHARSKRCGKPIVVDGMCGRHATETEMGESA